MEWNFMIALIIAVPLILIPVAVACLALACRLLRRIRRIRNASSRPTCILGLYPRIRSPIYTLSGFPLTRE